MILKPQDVLALLKLSEKLRRHNFSEVMSSDALICRWRCGETILDGRPEIIDEIQQADEELQSFLSDAFTELLNNNRFTDALPGHLPPDKASQSRLPIILNRIDSISKL